VGVLKTRIPLQFSYVHPSYCSQYGTHVRLYRSARQCHKKSFLASWVTTPATHVSTVRTGTGRNILIRRHTYTSLQNEQDHAVSKHDSNVQDTQSNEHLDQHHGEIIPSATQFLIHLTASSNVSPSQLEVMKLRIDHQQHIFGSLHFWEWKDQQTFGFLQPPHVHFVRLSAYEDCDALQLAFLWINGRKYSPVKLF